jgi:hypothetical protein
MLRTLMSQSGQSVYRTLKMSIKSVPLGTACLGFEKAVPNGTPKMIHYNFYKQIVLTGHSFCVTSVTNLSLLDSNHFL